MGLADQLRDGTSAAHQRVEQATLLKAVFQEGFERSGYVTLLERWFSFFQGFDNALQGFGFQGYVYEPRRALVQSDIEAFSEGLRYDGGSDYIGWRPVTFEEKLGAAYVIEGSSLGAKVICKQLRKVLGDEVLSALCFYSHQAVRWPTFRHWLDLEGARSRLAYGQVVEGANSTFRAVTDVMEPLDSHRLPTPTLIDVS